MTWPLPTLPPLSSDDTVNTEIIAVLATIGFVAFALSLKNTDEATSVITTGSDEDESISPFSPTCALRSVAAIWRYLHVSKPTRVGAAMSWILIASLLGLCFVPRLLGGFESDSIYPSSVCINKGAKTLEFSRVLLHGLYVSDRSLFYWVISAPLISYLTCALLEPSLGVAELTLTVVSGIPLTAFASSALLKPTQCIIGVDALLVALSVVVFFVNPIIRTSELHGSAAAVSLPFPIQGRWIAAVSSFGVLLFERNYDFGTVAVSGLFSGILLALPSLSRVDIQEIAAVASVWRRLAFTSILYISIFLLPASFSRIPTLHQLQQILSTLPATPVVGTRRLLRAFGPSSTVYDILLSEFYVPFSGFLLKFVLIWSVLALFTRQRGLTVVVAAAAVFLLLFVAASPSWRYPNAGVLGIGFASYRLMTAS